MNTELEERVSRMEKLFGIADDATAKRLTAIAEIVADHFKIDVALLSDKTRKREVIWPRHVAMTLGYDLTPAGYVAIGRHFGGRFHPSARYAAKAVKNSVATEKKAKAEYTLLKEKCEKALH